MLFARLLPACALLMAIGMGNAFAQSPPPTDSAPPAPPTQSQQAPASPAPQAETPVALPDDLARAITRFAAELDQVEKAVERDSDQDDLLATERGAIDVLQSAAEKILDDLRPRYEAVRLQIDKLGKPPAANTSAEAPAVAAERARLAAIAIQIDGAIKTTELGQERARQLIGRIQNLRYANFARDVLRRTPSSLRPALWRRVGEETPHAFRQFSGIARGWWLGAEGKQLEVFALLAASISLYFGLAIWRRRVLASWLDTPREAPPTFFKRAATAIWIAPVSALPAAAASTLLIIGFDLLGLIPSLLSGVFYTVLTAAIVFAGISALARTILQPDRPNWRLINLSDVSSGRLVVLGRAIALVFAADLTLQELIRLLYLPLHFGVALTFVMNLIFAGVLIAIVRTRFQPEAADVQVSRFAPRWLKLPLLAVAITIIGVSFAGYITLGRYIAGQVLVTGAGLVAFILLHLANNALAYGAEDSDRGVGRLLQNQFGLDEQRRSQLSRLLVILLDCALALISIPLLLLSWGFLSADILDWTKAAIFGFEIGQFRISLARILMAALLFIGLLLATRLVQRWLSNSVLQPPRVDAGIANSIHTGIGYAGICLAALFAISYAGLDVSNLAIVAGALSVGIGFGLQSAVNNFVSGIILLVERPIKVGDWIVVKGLEGYVRRISVRATEIETFDRASLIVPNSELVTGTVVNWTHRNAMCRLVIRINVSYNADPEKVHKVLMQVARASKSILQQPEPRAVFDNLGTNALEFSLRVYLADVNSSLDVQTELRTDVLKALRAAGIDISPTQRDAPMDYLVIRVGVSHEADPQEVHDLLLQVARASKSILQQPEPCVVLDDFGGSALQFSLRVFVADVTTSLAVQTELRTGILQALRAAGIQMPNTAHDIYLRDLDVVRKALTAAAEARRREQETVGATSPSR